MYIRADNKVIRISIIANKNMKIEAVSWKTQHPERMNKQLFYLKIP